MTTSDEEWDAEFPLFPGARRHLSNAIQYMAFRHKVEVDLSVIRNFLITEGDNPSINCFLGSFLFKITGNDPWAVEFVYRNGKEIINNITKRTNREDDLDLISVCTLVTGCHADLQKSAKEIEETVATVINKLSCDASRALLVKKYIYLTDGIE